MENKTCETCKKHRSCDGCFGASFGDCQRCQESREKEENATLGYKVEELAKAVREIYSWMPLVSKEDIWFVIRNPRLSFLQKWRIIKQIRKSMKNAQRTCETCGNAVYCGEGSCFCIESEERPKCVADDWRPAEDYFWCSGRKYEEDYDE